MNNKFYAFAFVAVAFVCFTAGYYAHQAPRAVSGAVVNYSNCGSQANCYNMLASLLQDVANVQSVASKNATTTAALGFVTLGPDGSTTSTASTTVTVTGVSLGDTVQIVAASTSTANIVVQAIATGANTVQFIAKNFAATIAQLPATSTYTVNDVKGANVLNAATLNTTTSTSN